MIDQRQHVRQLMTDLLVFRQWERYAVKLLASMADDEQEFAGADAAHDVILGAVRDIANELGKVYYQ